jgi:hypothetical protein
MKTTRMSSSSNRGAAQARERHVSTSTGAFASGRADEHRTFASKRADEHRAFANERAHERIKDADRSRL